MYLDTGLRRRLVEGARPPAGAADPGIEGSTRLRSWAMVGALIIGVTLVGISALPARAVPNATFSEGALHFANQKVGTTSSSRVVVVTNHGPGTLTINGINVTGVNAADFLVTGGGAPATIPANGTHSISVAFAPKAVGDRTAQLQLTDNGAGSPQLLALSGTGTDASDKPATPNGEPSTGHEPGPPTGDKPPAGPVPGPNLTPNVPLGPIVSLTPTSLNFPLRPVGSTSPVMTLKLKNVGGAPLHIINITFGGPIQTDFHFTANNAGTLNPGQSEDISLNFTPTTAGLRTTRVDVITDAPSNPDRVPVQGIGVATGGPNLPAVPAGADLFASAIDGKPTSGHPDQVFISVGQCLTLTMLVKFRGTDTVDVTSDPNTTFFTDPARDGFILLNHNNVFCPTAGDANRVFTIYGRAFSQSDHQVIGDTLIVHVLRGSNKKEPEPPHNSTSTGNTGGNK